jgi:hypothetical protein
VLLRKHRDGTSGVAPTTREDLYGLTLR